MSGDGVWTMTEAEFAAELRRERSRVLAEVRRVVEEIAGGEYCDQGAMARLILSRLDPLRVEDLLDGLPRLSTEAEARGIVDGKLVKMREYK